MKVLTVVVDLSIGGTQRVAQNLSIGVAALGTEVAVLAYRGGGPRELALQAAGIQVFKTVEEARSWRPDLIHIHRGGYANNEETRILRYLRERGGKVVETNVFSRFDWSEGGRLIDVHCNLSKWCAYKWNAWGGRLAHQKCSYILPNPVDAESITLLDDAARQNVRRELGIPSERFVFGRVGRPSIEKWSPTLVDAFETVAQQHDVGLLLVGAPPKIIQRTKALSADLQSRIIILPPTSSDQRLSELFNAMDGFLHLAGIGESFGMVLCEAMLAGVPVVTLSTPLKDNSQLEVVGHKKGGLVALSEDAIPRAMTCLIKDTRLRKAIRTGGRAWVDSRFSINLVSRRALEIYNAVLSDTQVSGDDAPPDWQWIRGMLSTGIGTTDRRAFLGMKLVHNPSIYQAYLAMRPWLKDVA